jgi:uncharacterized protein (UPF0261 family)
MKCIAVAGTLDTKGDEIRFVKELLEGKGIQSLTIDTGIRGEPVFTADAGRDAVLAAGGKTLQEIQALDDEQQAVAAMGEAFGAFLKTLHAEGKIGAALAVGGRRGARIAMKGLEQLPLGFPKAVVTSTIEQPDIKKDVLLFPSLCAMSGLNRVSRQILTSAIAALEGMAAGTEVEKSDSKLVTISMNNRVRPTALHVRELLEKDGYEVLLFDTSARQGKALEQFIREEEVFVSIELAVDDLGYELLTGTLNGRLEAAGEKGISQIVTPGCTDFVSFSSLQAIPEKYRGLRSRSEAQDIVLRTGKGEMSDIGKIMAGKLNAAHGKVQFLIPSRGFSGCDKEGDAFRDANADSELIRTLWHEADTRVKVVEVDMHINDREFGETLYTWFQSTIKN